ncbi:MAG: hypothetical protein HYT16_01050 [DPANN group archaeon]|nr:hypothetical protein [DPANN group archaeon]
MAIKLYLLIPRLETLNGWPKDEKGLIGILVAQRILSSAEKDVANRASTDYERRMLREWFDRRPTEYFASFAISVSQHKVEVIGALNDICEKHPDVIAIPAFDKLSSVMKYIGNLLLANYKHFFVVQGHSMYDVEEGAVEPDSRQVLSAYGKLAILLAEKETAEKYQPQVQAASELRREFDEYYLQRKDAARFLERTRAEIGNIDEIFGT